MAYEGYVDFANATEIRGWVFDDAAPDTPITVEVLADGVVVEKQLANGFRDDLVQHGKGNGCHAFSFHMQSSGANSPLQVRVEGKRWIIQPSGAVVAQRLSHVFLHSLEYGFPTLSHGFSTPSPSPDEPAILQRLIAAYHRAIQDDTSSPQTKADIWWELSPLHTSLIQLLRAKDAEGLGSYLRDAHNRGITYGITQGELTTNELRINPAATQIEASKIMDYLVSFAEHLGVLDVESPEQHGQWAENLHSDPEELIKDVEAVLGIRVVAPQVIGSLFGLQTSHGILSGRDLLALYGAFRLRDVAQRNHMGDPSICEIGGGLGGAAYYSALLGVRDYTIIDLPLINVLQGYYLLRALPEMNITLYGEQSVDSSRSFKILPPWEFEQSEARYSILFNMDSFPEMHIEYALAYLRRARHNISHYFLSINQEARAPQSGSVQQTVVRDLAAMVGGFEKLYRFRHWLKPGYVEELYRVSG